MPKRTFWLVTGAAIGAGSSLWAERKVRRTVQQATAKLQPDTLVVEVGRSAREVAGTAADGSGTRCRPGGTKCSAAKRSSGPNWPRKASSPAPRPPTRPPTRPPLPSRCAAPAGPDRGEGRSGLWQNQFPTWASRICGRDLRHGARRRSASRRLHPLLHRTGPYRCALGQPHPPRSVGALHHRRHGAVQAVLPRGRTATLAAGHLGAEVLPHRRHRCRRHHTPPLHVLRDARQLQLRGLLQV